MSVLELLHKKETEQRFDDIEVVNSNVEYSGSGDLAYLLFEMNAKDGTGNIVTLYKAIKLYRLVRVPKSIKMLTSFMDMQADVIAGLYRANVNYVQIIANILTPKPIGLVFCYGVQAVSTTSLDEAKRQADKDFAALARTYGGTFRTIEMRKPTFEEMDWLRKKMHTMKHVQVVRGLPLAKKATGKSNNSNMDGGRGNSESEETSEQFIIGMSDYEYIAVLMATPIEENVLQKWLTATSKEQTKWEGLLSGNKGMNFGLSLPMMYMANMGSSEGWSNGYSQGIAEGTSESTSLSESHGVTQGSSYTLSNGVTEGTSITQGESTTLGHSTGQSVGVSEGTSLTDSLGTSYSQGTNEGVNESDSTGTSESFSKGTSNTVTDGTSRSNSTGASWSSSDSTSSSRGHSAGISDSVSNSHSAGYNEGVSSSKGTSSSQGWNTGSSVSGGVPGVASGSISGGYNGSTGESETQGTSRGTSVSDSVGVSKGVSASDSTSFSSSNSTSSGGSSSVSTGTSHSVSRGTSETATTGTSTTHSVGSSKGISEGWSQTASQSAGKSSSLSASNSVSDSLSKGTSLSHGQSFSRSQSESVGQSYSESSTVGRSTGHTDSVTASKAQNQGYSGALNSGTSGTMGVGPSLSWSKTFAWKDIEVENILMLLQFQHQRLMAANNGQGAFFVDFMIATESEEAKATAKATATSAWLDKEAYVSPLQILDLPPHEEKHLLYHLNAFSPCLTKEGIPGQMEGYKYSTVLLADELAAYSHPPRVSDGGLYAEVEDMPVLSVPSNRQDGDIFVGNILSGEKYSPEHGYVTPFAFKIQESEIMHAFFQGGSRSGKTVTATRVIAELANNVRRGPRKKRMRIIAMDPKKDWRILARFVEPERFRFYSLADPDFLPAKLNLTKIPKNVWPERYLNSVVEVFCRSYGLGERGKQILTRALFEEYTKAGVFAKDWRKHASERSAKVTLETVYRNLESKKMEMDDPRAKAKYGNDARDAFTRVMDRMEAFGRVGSILHTVFCDPEGQGIDDILGEDDVVVLESYGLESTARSFVFGLVTSAIYQYAVHNGGFVEPEDQFETILVIEEANEVLIGQDSGNGDSGGGLSGPSEFERILDQAAGNGLFIWAITQKISMLPTSIIANCGLVFAGRTKIPDDINVIIRQIGREERYDDRALVKWYPRCPTGWFTVQTSRTFDFKDAEPVMVKVEQLKVSPPKNEELEQLMRMRDIKKPQV